MEQLQTLDQMVARIPLNIERKEAPDIELQIKAIRDEIVAKVGGNVEQMLAMQKQLDALDVKMQERNAHQFEGETLKSLLEKSDDVSRLLRDKKGSAVLTIPASLLERKTTIVSSAVGVSTSGVLQIERLPGLTTEARQQLTIRDLLTARPTVFQVIDFVKVNQPMTPASPVAEASTKPENAITFVSASERIKTIATWIPASKQILDDLGELLGFLDTTLRYEVDLAEEQQLLSGDGTGENLHGLIPQATAFSTGLLSATKGWTKIDIIGRSIQQTTAAKEFPPTFIALHPNDWWDIRLTKDGFGRYILGDPQNGSLTINQFGSTAPVQNLFSLMVDATTNIAPGTFLVGSGSPAASEIRDRMETVVEISTSHADFFIKNLIAIRAERREALIVKRPASYISGSFSSSPA